jgi:hypothetical protein
MIRPGLVYPSGKPATRTDYDCEVGSLSSRESWGQLKSGESKALSNFFEKKSEKTVYKHKRTCYNIHIN